MILAISIGVVGFGVVAGICIKKYNESVVEEIAESPAPYARLVDV